MSAASSDQFDVMREQWKRERPDLDPSGLEVLGRISFLHRHLRRAAAKRLAGIDLPGWALDVLANLRRQGAPFELSPSELSEAAMLTSGAMTNRLDRLEESRLVERHPDPTDRRAVIVRLTDEGKEMVDRAIEIRFEQANDALAPLSASERDRLIELLRKLVVARISI